MSQKMQPSSSADPVLSSAAARLASRACSSDALASASARAANMSMKRWDIANADVADAPRDKVGAAEQCPAREGTLIECPPRKYETLVVDHDRPRSTSQVCGRSVR